MTGSIVDPPMACLYLNFISFSNKNISAIVYENVDLSTCESQDIDQNACELSKDFASSSERYSIGPPSLSHNMGTCVSLHEDIAYTVESLRSSLLSDVPNEINMILRRKTHAAALTRSSTSLPVFNPHMMPFAASWVKSKERHLMPASKTAACQNSISF